MNVSSGTRRRRQPQPANKQPSVQNITALVNKRINTITKGTSFRPPTTPADFELQIWNPATIRQVTTCKNRILISTADVYGYIWKQMGAYYEPGGTTTYYAVNLEWKVQSLSVWNIEASGVHGFIRLCPMNFVSSHENAGSQELANPSSMGQKNMYPAIGYRYPIDHQNFVIYSTPDETKPKTTLAMIDTNDNSTIEIHWRVLWRCAGGSEIKHLYEATPLSLRPRALDEQIVSSILEGGARVKALMAILQPHYRDPTELGSKIDNIIAAFSVEDEETSQFSTLSTEDTPRRSERLRSKIHKILQ